MNMDLPSSPGPSGSGEELDDAWNPIFLEEHEEGNKEDWADLAVSDDEDDVAEPTARTAGDPVPSQAPDPSIPLVVPWLPPRHNVVHWAPDPWTPMATATRAMALRFRWPAGLSSAIGGSSCRPLAASS